MLNQKIVVRDSLMSFSTDDSYYISEKYRTIANIKATNQELDCHPVCSVLNSSSRIEAFILYHIFDAWDTNKLVRPLQNKINIALQEKPYKYKYNRELKRLLEKTIFNFSAELCYYDRPHRDFANYLHAVAEVCVDIDSHLWYFLEASNNLAKLKPEIKALVEFDSSVANWGTISEMIAVLLLRRKQFDLQVFTKIIRVLTSEGQECPFLLEYIEQLRQDRAIQSEMLAFKLLNYFSQDEAEQIRALQTGLKALHLRKQLWNYAFIEIRKI